ncbi:MAG: response regulator [Planctomycetes bacterium]|nr:response regulator [Planctomycetota bacterium]
MTHCSLSDLENRVLVLAPTGRDASTLCDVLDRAGVESTDCATAADLCRQIGRGAAAAVIADEALSDDTVGRLASVLTDQPEWSDFPLVLMTGQREERRIVWTLLEELNGSAHPLLLERPVSTGTLVRTIRTVLQSRRRQYQVRDQLIERKQLEGELLQKVEALAESDRRKERFLAVLGHELRNPLAAIVNGIRVLPLIGDLDDRVGEVCDLLGRQADQMTHLVDDLLDVSRVNSGRVRLRLKQLDLAPLIRNVAEEYRAAAEDSGCELEIHVPESLPARGDLTRLRQVVGNLVHNACKFTNRGGRISISAHGDADRSQAAIAVRDTGIGMSAESLARLFEPFHQVDISLDRSRGGLGLGLALVRGLVDLHGGTVTAHSEGEGRGSEFVVRLPMSAEPDPAAPQAEPPVATQGRRILIVDDNVTAARMLRLLLSQLGNQEVQVVHDGPAAVKAASSFRPEIILLDIGLPEMDGYEVARRLRAAPEHDGVLLVALTGYGMEEDRLRSQVAGFDEHCVKPLADDALQKLMRHAKLRNMQ